jgi:NADH:ubiquinone oxidoreductase subunit 5 (subunit L)/multisubunit Na+/H+ antiporter MnhA subunit
MLRVKLWAPLGWVHHWLRNRLYLDTLYDQLVVGITRLLALIAWFIDRSGFDVLVNYAGWLTRGTANAVDVLDRRGVDGGVVGAGHLARWGGARLSQTQNGRLLYYFAAVFITALIAGLVLLMSPPMFERWQSYLNLWLTPWAY